MSPPSFRRAVVRAAVRAGAAAICVAALAACSDPEPSKPTFMGLSEGQRQKVNTPEGLNPLGALEPCRDRAGPVALGPRVLVSRPDQFTREASLMLSNLRQALVEERADRRAVQFQIAPRPILSPVQAREEGARCGALVVLWEPFGTRALEMTVSESTRIPIRAKVYTRLCEFGNYQEQIDILYLTIVGLLALLDNQHDRALYSLDQAKRLDSRCLQLPGVAQ